MDAAFAFTGKDYVLLASDRSVAHSIVKMKDDEKKVLQIGNNQLICSLSQEVSTRKEFSSLVEANLEYYYYRYNNRLTTHEVANYTRSLVAENLRTRDAMMVSNLIAGVDDGKPSLYVSEMYGSMEKVDRGVLGYAAHFLYGTMDSYFSKDLPLNDGKSLMKKCMNELKTRFLINIQDYDVYIIDKDGVKDISTEFNTK